jgi:hypothetical protein
MTKPHPVFETAPNGVRDVAKGNHIVAYPAVDRGAYGTVEFLAQLTPGTTITLGRNGGTTLTAVAGAAGAGQFSIGVNVAATFANFVTAFGGIAFPFRENTQSEVIEGAEILKILLNDIEESGAVYTLATNRPALVRVSGSKMFEPMKADVLDPNVAETFIIDLHTAIGGDMFKLLDGNEGQSIAIYVRGPELFTANIQGSFPGAYVALLLDIEEYAVLRFLGGKWRPVVNTGELLT